MKSLCIIKMSKQNISDTPESLDLSIRNKYPVNMVFIGVLFWGEGVLLLEIDPRGTLSPR